jgi:hypothetical protein
VDLLALTWRSRTASACRARAGLDEERILREFGA